MGVTVLLPKVYPTSPEIDDLGKDEVCQTLIHLTPLNLVPAFCVWFLQDKPLIPFLFQFLRLQVGDLSTLDLEIIAFFIGLYRDAFVKIEELKKVIAPSPSRANQYPDSLQRPSFSSSSRLGAYLFHAFRVLLFHLIMQPESDLVPLPPSALVAPSILYESGRQGSGGSGPWSTLVGWAQVCFGSISSNSVCCASS